MQKQYKTALDAASFRALRETTVLASPDSPTGWVVSFRYVAPELDRVGVLGDWMFSDEHASSCSLAADRMPHEWRPGDFLHKTGGMRRGAHPVPPVPGKPGEKVKLDPISIGLDPDQFLKGMYEMEKDPETGVFSCTIPLPSGSFLYQFAVDFTEDPFQTGFATDPANPPRQMAEGEQRFSTITIPESPACAPHPLEQPVEPSAQGEVRFVTYDGPFGEQPLTLCLPAGYDPDRAEPYPVLYLSHGGNGHHSDWLSQGVADRIMDHLTAAGRVEPTIVAMMENEVFGWDNANKCIPNLLEGLIPYMERTYNVSHDPKRRAFAGLSMGGMLTFELFASYTKQFGYYGIFSGANMKSLPYPAIEDGWPRVHVGFGTYEGGFGNAQRKMQDEMVDAYVPFTTSMVPGGHQWSVWRKNLEDFASRVLWK